MKNIDFAANYSTELLELIDNNEVSIDRIKCPAWNEIISKVNGQLPFYVHFPFRVGGLDQDAINTETNQTVNWQSVEKILDQSPESLINVHLWSKPEEYSRIPNDSIDPQDGEYVAEHMIRDIEAIVKRFGKEHIIAENVLYEKSILKVALLPTVINQVVEETGVRFLLDIAHAKIASEALGIEVKKYINDLPVHELGEIHVSGVQFIRGQFLARLKQTGMDKNEIEQLEGLQVDHMPLSETDLELSGWAFEQVKSNLWGRPRIICFEYGGIKPAMWSCFTDKVVLNQQIHALQSLL